MSEAKAAELVTLKIDNRSVTVPKGTNLIEAAKSAGIDIPYYCYHPHHSGAGNCRMCQIEIKGRPKLEIGCNTVAQEGMEVLTQHTSSAVKSAQEATLEFILINHPLDCTVCDQAGHCKLQDYHFEYNARPSRFVEQKVNKVKAEPLGPTVMLDGERCIMCSRCVRFCDEVTKTSELGLLNRGDQTVIAVNPGRELNNPLSGTVVDLCPVGALTHREWRFNTRIWFTRETNSICPGCSTGCNVRVAARDQEIVGVKACLNSEVNKEWLCDQGRYGFDRFLPKSRVISPQLNGRQVSWNDALGEVTKLKVGENALFVSPDLLLEEYVLLKALVERHLNGAKVFMAYRERQLTQTEAILISPDFAANFRGAEFAGLVSGDLEKNYEAGLAGLRAGSFKNVLVVGDRGILSRDIDSRALGALRACGVSVAIVTDADSGLATAASVVVPGRSILEKSGLLINRKMRMATATPRVMMLGKRTQVLPTLRSPRRANTR